MLKDDFLDALSNEVVVENYMYKVQKLNPEDFSYLPRISKLVGVNYLPVIKFMARFIHLFWPIIVSPIFNFFCLIKYIFKKNKFPDIQKAFINESDVVVLSGVEGGAKVKRVFNTEEANIIVRPDVDLGDCNDYKCINILSLITYRDLFIAFMQAIKNYYRSFKRKYIE